VPTGRAGQTAGNKQSALVNEVKEVLRITYPQTDMRGDGQVVAVGFNTITVEVVPVFPLRNGQFIMPDTNSGGRWKAVDPAAEVQRVEQVDAACASNLRALIKMLKVWNRERNVRLKSFVLELLASEFLTICPWRLCGYFYYDWIIRDFFIFLNSKAWANAPPSWCGWGSERFRRPAGPRTDAERRRGGAWGRTGRPWRVLRVCRNSRVRA
jgi:Second Messenger Oligonucleotide or Dinucleotide Synthetase domain